MGKLPDIESACVRSSRKYSFVHHFSQNLSCCLHFIDLIFLLFYSLDGLFACCFISVFKLIMNISECSRLIYYSSHVCCHSPCISHEGKRYTSQ